MAEQVPVIEATNFFSLPAAFGIKGADTTGFQTFAPVFDANGNYLCSQEFDLGDNYTNEADYCGGGSPDIVASLATFLTAFGDVEGSGLVTQNAITFTAGESASIALEGHQHDTEVHVAGTLRTADVSGIIPAGSGVGVPELIVVTGTVSPVNATVTFEMEHVDKVGADGVHFAGQNMRCHVTLSADYEGTLTGFTAGDWLNVIIAKSNPNDDTPTSTLTAEQWVDVAVPTP